MNRILIFSILFFLNIHIAQTQVDTIFSGRRLAFDDYLQMVSSHNLEYAAEKYNVSISEAVVQIAKIMPDPYISIEQTDVRDGDLRTGIDYESELGMLIELGGKRRARIDLAKSENEMTKALLSDFFRNLRADAAIVYLEALKKEQIFRVGLKSYETMKQLSDADSIRYSLGSIMQIDAIQSKLEADKLHNELIHSLTEWRNSLSQLTLMTGLYNSDTVYVPVTPLNDNCRIFSLNDLITEALNNRADLIAAQHNIEASRKDLILAKRERMADLGLRAGLDKSFFADGITPVTTGIMGGFDISIPFSALSRGYISLANARIDQSEEIYKLVEMQIRSEITQAWRLYYVHCQQVDKFETGLLAMASEVLKGKIYSYQRGESSLLEVLNAQRTFNDLQTDYYEALSDRASALVNLERSAGIWDINI